MRKLGSRSLLAMLGCLPSLAMAFGLGELTLHSALNQPLAAEIEVINIGKTPKSSIKFSIGSQEAFDSMGMSRPFFLNKIKFNWLTKNSKLYLRLNTEQPVKEPFLNFLIEVNWPNGRIVREYTVLLNPPTYSFQENLLTVAPREVFTDIRQPVLAKIEREPKKQYQAKYPAKANNAVIQHQPASRAAQLENIKQQSTTLANKTRSKNQPTGVVLPSPLDEMQPLKAKEAAVKPALKPVAKVAPAQTKPEHNNAAIAKVVTDKSEKMTDVASMGKYGPVKEGENLWRIALKNRPAKSINPSDLVKAIHAANPKAFLKGNLHQLMVGATLRIPTAAQLENYLATGDFGQTKADMPTKKKIATSQNGSQSAKNATKSAATPMVQAHKAAQGRQDVAGPVDHGAKDVAQLKVITPVSHGKAKATSSGDSALVEELKRLKNQLLITNESFDATKRRNEQLEAELKDLKAQLKDLRKLANTKQNSMSQAKQMLRDARQRIKAKQEATHRDMREHFSDEMDELEKKYQQALAENGDVDVQAMLEQRATRQLQDEQMTREQLMKQRMQAELKQAQQEHHAKQEVLKAEQKIQAIKDDLAKQQAAIKAQVEQLAQQRIAHQKQVEKLAHDKTALSEQATTQKVVEQAMSKAKSLMAQSVTQKSEAIKQDAKKEIELKPMPMPIMAPADTLSELPKSASVDKEAQAKPTTDTVSEQPISSSAAENMLDALDSTKKAMPKVADNHSSKVTADKLEELSQQTAQQNQSSPEPVAESEVKQAPTELMPKLPAMPVLKGSDKKSSEQEKSQTASEPSKTEQVAEQKVKSEQVRIKSIPKPPAMPKMDALTEKADEDKKAAVEISVDSPLAKIPAKSSSKTIKESFFNDFLTDKTMLSLVALVMVVVLSIIWLIIRKVRQEDDIYVQNDRNAVQDFQRSFESEYADDFDDEIDEHYGSETEDYSIEDEHAFSSEEDYVSSDLEPSTSQASTSNESSVSQESGLSNSQVKITELIDAGQYDQALRLLTDEVVEDNHNIEWRYLLCVCYAKLGELEAFDRQVSYVMQAIDGASVHSRWEDIQRLRNLTWPNEAWPGEQSAAVQEHHVDDTATSAPAPEDDDDNHIIEFTAAAKQHTTERPTDTTYTDNDYHHDTHEIDLGVAHPPGGVVHHRASEASDLQDQAESIEPEQDNASVAAETSESVNSKSEASSIEDVEDGAVKLELARAYVDMGDTAAARDILKEIIKLGDIQLTAEAQVLLDDIGED